MELFKVVWEKFVKAIPAEYGSVTIEAESRASLEEVILECRGKHYYSGPIVLRIEPGVQEEKHITLHELREFLCT